MQPLQPSQPVRLVVEPGLAGTRLDRAIADWRGLSRTAAWRLLDHGAVTRNGHVMRRGDKGGLLQAGDVLELDQGYADGEAPRPDGSMRLEVIAEGEGWLAVNKPAGVPVRPHRLDETGTVLNAVVSHAPSVVGVGEGGLRSGVVHRLDTDTSGVVAVATRQQAWQKLRDAFAEHRVQKRYEALVVGVPDEQGTAKRSLWITQHAPAQVQTALPGEGPAEARDCSLDWRVLERFGDQASLIEVDLHTGFLHQIRVMMNSLGHPVIGDAQYGGDRAQTLSVPRQMLHAKSLVYEQLLAQAPRPADMEQAINRLRG